MNTKIKIAYRFWRVDAVGVAAFVLLSVALWFLGVGPVLAREAERLEIQSSIKETTQSIETMGDSYAELSGQLQLLDSAIESSSVKLKPVSYLNSRVAELTALAALENLVVEAVQPGALQHGERYETIPVEISGRGSYVECTSFLARLFSDYPDTSVHALNMTGKPRQPALQAEFRFTLHWHAAPSVIGSGL